MVDKITGMEDSAFR